VYIHILINAKLQIGEREVRKQLSRRSPLRQPRYVLDCSTIEEEEFLTLTLDGGEWSASLSGLFTSTGRSPISAEETQERIYRLLKRFLPAVHRAVNCNIISTVKPTRYTNV